MTEHNIEDIALENMLNAKLAQMINCKNVRFRQYRHSEPKCVCYFAMCFLSSGAGKSITPTMINTHLLWWLKKDISAKFSKYREEYYNQNVESIIDKKEKKDARKIVNEYLRTIPENYDLDISNATFTGLYKIADCITKIGAGAISILIDEFGDFISSIVAGDLSNKELYESFKGLFEGEVKPKKIAGEVRSNIFNMPTSAMFLTDYSRLTEPKINQYFITSLKTGFARRCFVYISDDKDKQIYNNWKEKEKALENARDISDWLHSVYDSIPEGNIYDFSDEAQARIQEYHSDCIKRFNELRKDDIITATEIEGSFWKITKLAVINHVIDNPANSLISLEAVEKAIDFYNRIQPCLQKVINKRPENDDDRLIKLLRKWVKNGGEPIKKGDIMKQLGINKNVFGKWIKESMPEAIDKMEREGYYITEFKGYGGNTKAWQYVKKN